MISTLIAASMIAAPSQTPSRESLTVKNYLRLMSPGINLGNTLEAIPEATSWGNPKPTRAYFKGIRSAGFKSVRLPIAWSQYSDSNHTIRADWMKHVTEVVKLAREADLIVMINVHWDGGWLQPTPEKKEFATKKLRAFWKQIATNFREFDHNLLFAGTNETGVEGQYGIPAKENADIQNGFNQAFVETVRSTEGLNRSRFIVVQAYNTDIDTAMKVNMTMPVDTTKDRLMMEVHYYSPYNFTLNDKSDIWQWGKSATDPKSTETWANEEYVDAQFAKVKAAYVDRGFPVILGEYCCGMKTRFPEMDKYRLLWDQCVTESAIRHGVVPMLWDTGSAFDRVTGAPKTSNWSVCWSKRLP
ncbi:MAG TPA: glycoside hydrolase family 5 protein [Fimbriimonas sp.]|nr:glycoside hydrolase family 5 protein [Fimbriimonas sp.]